MNKLKNAYTVNVDDDYKKMIDLLACYYRRKPAEYLRLLLIDAIIKDFAIYQSESEKNIIEKAIFKK